MVKIENISAGLTVKKLKEIINQMPDLNNNGEPLEIWISTGDCLSSIVTQVSPLNRRPEGSDLLLTPSQFSGC